VSAVPLGPIATTTLQKVQTKKVNLLKCLKDRALNKGFVSAVFLVFFLLSYRKW